VRGKTPRDVWRNYEPKRMNEIPYRRPEGDPRAEEIAGLVRRIAGNRRALLPHRALFPRLTSIVKDPWKTGTPAVDPGAAIATLDPADVVSVRLDSRLGVHLGEAPLGTATRVGSGAIEFRRARKVTGRIDGPESVLDVLEGLLGGADDPGAVLLPKDLGAYRTLIATRGAEVTALLAEGRRLVEEVERLVCALYDVPGDLTDEVVARAAARARRGVPDAAEDEG
jgi:hypothetical protein